MSALLQRRPCAGFRPWCIDIFADVDLCALAPTIHCAPAQFPQAIPDLIKESPIAPVIYTGGLENHPNLIRRISELRPLWGNHSDALLRSRSPFAVAKLLHDVDLPVPETRPGDAELPGNCRWLRKPFAGSAGFGIHFVDQCLKEQNDRFYHQEFIPGTPMSASYVALRDETNLLGVTEQLIGESWLFAPPFRYCGNIGPIHVSSTLRDTLTRIGEVIASGCGLRGLFGIDFIVRDQVPWLVEVNPRYTASMEVLERFSALPYLTLHRAAFEPTHELVPANFTIPAGMVGKAILYARLW